jgi:hypothetical protein
MSFLIGLQLGYNQNGLPCQLVCHVSLAAVADDAMPYVMSMSLSGV